MIYTLNKFLNLIFSYFMIKILKMINAKNIKIQELSKQCDDTLGKFKEKCNNALEKFKQKCNEVRSDKISPNMLKGITLGSKCSLFDVADVIVEKTFALKILPKNKKDRTEISKAISKKFDSVEVSMDKEHVYVKKPETTEDSKKMHEKMLTEQLNIMKNNIRKDKETYTKYIMNSLKKDKTNSIKNCKKQKIGEKTLGDDDINKLKKELDNTAADFNKKITELKNNCQK